MDVFVRDHCVFEGGNYAKTNRDQLDEELDAITSRMTLDPRKFAYRGMRLNEAGINTILENGLRLEDSPSYKGGFHIAASPLTAMGYAFWPGVSGDPVGRYSYVLFQLDSTQIPQTAKMTPDHFSQEVVTRSIPPQGIVRVLIYDPTEADPSRRLKTLAERH